MNSKSALAQMLLQILFHFEKEPSHLCSLKISRIKKGTQAQPQIFCACMPGPPMKGPPKPIGTSVQNRRKEKSARLVGHTKESKGAHGEELQCHYAYEPQ